MVWPEPDFSGEKESTLTTSLKMVPTKTFLAHNLNCRLILISRRTRRKTSLVLAARRPVQKRKKAMTLKSHRLDHTRQRHIQRRTAIHLRQKCVPFIFRIELQKDLIFSFVFFFLLILNNTGNPYKIRRTKFDKIRTKDWQIISGFLHHVLVLYVIVTRVLIRTWLQP